MLKVFELALVCKWLGDGKTQGNFNISRWNLGVL